MAWATPDSSSPWVDTGRCQRCGRDVGGLPLAASFCPGCGLQLRVELSHWAAVRDGLQAWLHVRRRQAEATPGAADGASWRTPILTGYGNALYSLGWRYERGWGARSNEQEAVRCYRKSARLGNLDAAMRLAAVANPEAQPVLEVPAAAVGADAEEAQPGK